MTAAKDREAVMQRRYALLPALRDYDRLTLTGTPYLMFFNQPEFRSAACTTDALGFRFSYAGDTAVDYAGFRAAPGRKRVLLGGSTAFGIGVSSDRLTLASRLNETGGLLCCNAGLRAGNSTQELLTCLLRFADIDGLEQIIIVSGINDLELLHSAPVYGGDGGAFYYQQSCPLAGAPLEHWLWLERPASALLRERNWQWLRRKAAHFLRGRTRSPRAAGSPDDLQRLLRRNLGVLGSFARARGIDITYVLQPFALWLDRELSPEEAELFALLDALPDNPLRDHAAAMRRQRGTYTAMVEQAARAGGVRFIDATAHFNRPGWLFADRVHLTDDGTGHLAALLSEAGL